MTDTTEARRALLALLLDRVEREALLPAEAPLLRPLVAAEMADADTRATAAHGANEEAWDWHDRASQARGTIGRVRKLAARWENGLPPDLPYARSLRAALDGPSPTPDDTPTTARYGGPLCHDTDPTTLKECALKAGHSGDHADANVTWPRQPDDAPATPVLDALRTGQPVELLFCSPLVNAACPGHDAPPYCDRAPSSLATPAAAPDWTTAPEPRTYRLTADGNPIERTVVVPAADAPTTAPDDDPADGSSGTPILDGMLAGYRAQHPADDGPSLGACRVMPTRTCPEYAEPCGDRCARFESEDPAPWTGDDAPSEPQQ